MAAEQLPSILVSFAYAKGWAKNKHLTTFREVILDSGAYTAWGAGETIDLQEFAEWAKEQIATDPRVTEVFTLDVIGGTWQESLRNTEALWKQGIEAIPVFHVGEPTSVLKALARDYPKISLGGAVGYARKVEWASLCFREVWPKKIHGLGFGHTMATKLPWHSLDSSSWSIMPLRFGKWACMPHKATTIPIKRPRRVNRWSEVEYFLREEENARMFWRGRLPADFGDAPTIHLASCWAPGDILTLTEGPPKQAST